MVAVAIAFISVFAACQKEEIKVSPSHFQTKEAKALSDSPIKGNWQLLAVKSAGENAYHFPQTPVTLHITNTEVIEWGPYTYTATTISVNGSTIQYQRTGNLLVFTFSNGDVWRLGRT